MDLFSPFRNAVYRRLMLGEMIMLVGTGLATVALGLLAYDLAEGEAGLVLGTALAIKMIAYVTITPLSSGVVHLVPRRVLLASMAIGRAGVISLMPFVTEVWQIYVLIFLLNGFAGVYSPTFQATIPDILTDEEEYTKALSITRLAYELENLASPTLAALALTFFSYSVLFQMNAAAFAIVASIVLLTSLPKLAVSEKQTTYLRRVSRGTILYFTTARLRGVLALMMAVSAGGSMVIVNSVVLVRDRFGGSETDLAIALGASGAGSMLTALLMPKLLSRLQDRSVMLTGGGLLTLGLVLGPLVPAFPAFLALWVLMGVGFAAIYTPVGRILTRSVAEEDRQAIFSAQFALSHACWLVAYPIAGWSGPTLGLDASFHILAALCIASTGAAAMLWKRES